MSRGVETNKRKLITKRVWQKPIQCSVMKMNRIFSRKETGQLHQISTKDKWGKSKCSPDLILQRHWQEQFQWTGGSCNVVCYGLRK